MADSPRCVECLKKGLPAFMYKVAGKPFFKCRDCKNLFKSGSFEPKDFLWNDDKDSWREHMTRKGVKIVSS